MIIILEFFLADLSKSEKIPKIKFLKKPKKLISPLL